MKRKRINNKGKSEHLNKKRKIVNTIGKIGASSDFGWTDLGFSDSKIEEEYVIDEQKEKEEKNAKILKTKKQKGKKLGTVLKESIVLKKEKELQDPKIQPESVNDFERLLFAEPNNSFLWIKYISFKLSLSDIEGARKIVRKALKKIEGENVKERLNIFLALINLENKFGSAQQQQDAFNFSMKNSPKRKDIFLHKAKLMDQELQIKNVDEKAKKDLIEDHFIKINKFYRKILKKYKTSKKCFVEYANFLMRNKKFKEIEEHKNRILTNFPKEKKFQTLVKIGISFYKAGLIIEGHGFFERLIQTFPKRSDIWSIFIQMEENAKRYDQCRKLFNRQLSINLSNYKKKKVLKKFYSFEEKYGDENDLENVKKAAQNFVEQ